MDKFIKNIKEEKKYFKIENNEISLVQSYVINELFNDYLLSYILFLYLNYVKSKIDDKNRYRLIIILNTFYINIDVILNLKNLTNTKITNNIPSINFIFDDTICMIGLLFLTNNLLLELKRIYDNSKLNDELKYKLIKFSTESFVELNNLGNFEKSVNSENEINEKDVKFKDLEILFSSNHKSKISILNEIREYKKNKFIHIFLRIILMLIEKDNNEQLIIDHRNKINLVLNKTKDLDWFIQELKNF